MTDAGLTCAADVGHAAGRLLRAGNETHPRRLQGQDALAVHLARAAAATDGLEWIALRKPPGAVAYAAVILALITAFIGYIAVRTVILVARGQLLPPRAVPEKVKIEVVPNHDRAVI